MAETLDGHDAGDGFAHDGEEAPKAGMEEERLLVEDEVLIEGEAARDRPAAEC